MFRDETSDGACSCEIEDFFYWIKLNNDIFQRSWSESVGYETWNPRGNLRWLRSSGPTVAMLWPPKAWKPFQLWHFLTSPVSCGELYQKNLLIATPLLCNEQTENKFVFHVAIYSQKISWGLTGLSQGSQPATLVMWKKMEAEKLDQILYSGFSCLVSWLSTKIASKENTTCSLKVDDFALIHWIFGGCLMVWMWLYFMVPKISWFW